MKNKRYTEEEKRVIAEFFDPKRSTATAHLICQRYLTSRTPVGIQYAAAAMGLTRKYRCPKWNDKEISKIKELGDRYPFPVIYSQMKYFWNKNKMKSRSELSVRHQLNRMGFSVDDSFYLTVKDVASGLNCTERIVRRWFEKPEFAKLLNPARNSEKEGTVVYIHPRNLARFAKEYPGEIAKCHPDILWLVTMLTSD